MPLSKTTIKVSLKNLIEALNESNDPEDQDQAIDNFCDEMADWMIETLQTATVTIPTGGVVVATTGTAAAQTGANTTPAIGSLS